MEFAARPVAELISLTARDVHPPLYYMIVRMFLLMGQGLGIVGGAPGQLAPEILAKLVSILPFFILMIYSLTTVRKHYGLLASGLFSFAIISMPQLPEYTTEIRMYSWTILFVTAALLHAMSLIRSEMAGNEAGWDVADALALWLYSSAAAYSHYYGAFSVGIILGIMLIWMIVYFVKNMKSENLKSVNVKALALAIGLINLTAASYVPWISVVLKQVSAVKANYWIQPVGLRSLGSCAKYLFKGYFTNEALATVIAVALFILIAFMFARTVMRAFKSYRTVAANSTEAADLDSRTFDVFTLYAFMILPLLIFAGLLASWLIRPVFVNRYMLPAYGCFWLAVSIMVAKELETGAVLGKAKAGMLAAALLLVLMAVVGAVDFKTFIGNEQYRKVNMDKTLALFEELDSDTIIISNFNHVQGLLSYYLNKGEGDYKIYLYQEKAEPLIEETVPGLLSIDDPIDIANYLEGGKKVLFLGSFNSRDVLVKEWEDNLGIKNENQGSYLMERYWFDVFKLSL
ncbi:hypothetical protein [Butyrivibrio sp. AE2032]|uniref:hypothetical protein n=1 Tax=Butyrivibrio sp. AE2032 TaxID=1458463 RepID=UPI000AD8CE7D|nr:hypothetical protein [Butyrivibrio sp. AE2032]